MNSLLAKLKGMCIELDCDEINVRYDAKKEVYTISISVDGYTFDHSISQMEVQSMNYDLEDYLIKTFLKLMLEVFDA